jgi:hypothetical protein
MRLDRRAVLAALVLVALASIMFVARSRSSTKADDTKARADLLALAAKRERGTWLVEFRFTRRLASGATLHQTVTEANRPPVHIDAGGDGVTVDFGNRVTSCTTTSKGPRCITEKSAPSLAPAAVYRVVTKIGAYRVRPETDTTIAGEHAECFRLIAITSPRTIPSLGTETEQCYAADGVPLRSSVVNATSTDTRTALTVTRAVTNARLNALLHQLDQNATTPGQ